MHKNRQTQETTTTSTNKTAHNRCASTYGKGTINRALKGHAESYGIELQDTLNPLNHFTKTKVLVESHLEDLLKTMKGFKFIETLEVTFEKETIDSKTRECVSIYKTAFFNGKAKTITKANDIEPELSMSRQEILNLIDKWVSEGSGWVISRIDSHYINIDQVTLNYQRSLGTQRKD